MVLRGERHSQGEPGQREFRVGVHRVNSTSQEQQRNRTTHSFFGTPRGVGWPSQVGPAVSPWEALALSWNH